MTLEKIIKTHSIFKDGAWIIFKKKDINIPHISKAHSDTCLTLYELSIFSNVVFSLGIIFANYILSPPYQLFLHYVVN